MLFLRNELTGAPWDPWNANGLACASLPRFESIVSQGAAFTGRCCPRVAVATEDVAAVGADRVLARRRRRHDSQAAHDTGMSPGL